MLVTTRHWVAPNLNFAVRIFDLENHLNPNMCDIHVTWWGDIFVCPFRPCLPLQHIMHDCHQICVNIRKFACIPVKVQIAVQHRCTTGARSSLHMRWIWLTYEESWYNIRWCITHLSAHHIWHTLYMQNYNTNMLVADLDLDLSIT